MLAVLAALSAVGGFVAIPHFLEPMLAATRGRPRRCTASRRRSSSIAVAVGLAGLAVAAYFYGGNGERAGAGARAGSPACTGMLASKYFVDELYDALDRPTAATGSPTGSSSDSAIARSSTAR